MSRTKVAVDWIVVAAVVLCIALGIENRTSAAEKEKSRQPAAPGAEEKQPPTEKEPLIPCGPDAYTAHNYRKIALPLFEKVLVKAYRKHGKRDAKWDEKLELFIRECAKTRTSLAKSVDELALYDMAKEIRETECDDPLFRGLLFALVEKTDLIPRQREEAIALIEDAKKAGYPLLTQLIIVEGVRGAVTGYNHQDLIQLNREVITAGIQEVVSKKIENQNECRPACSILGAALGSLKKQGLEQADKILKNAMEDDRGDPWLIHTLRGQTNISLAWQWRGIGLANSVTKEGWKGMHKHLAVANEQLRKAHELHPERPEAAASMINVAAAGNVKESPLYWFREAVKAQMDYYLAYEYIMNFIEPKWGGSLSLMLAFGMECKKTERYDTWVPMHFYTIMSQIDRLDDAQRAAFRQPQIYPILKEIFENYEKSPDFAARRGYIRSRYAIIAWLCREYSDSLAVLNRLDDDQRLFPDATEEYGLAPPSFRNEVHALGGPAGKLVFKANEAYDDGDFALARDSLEKALRKAGEDRYATIYTKGRLIGLDVEEKLDTGKWVDLTFDKDLTGWWIARGRFEPTGKKSVCGFSSTIGNRQMLLHFANLGHRFQYEAEGEVSASAPFYDSTLVFCHALAPLHRFRTFILRPGERRIAICRDFVFGDFMPIKAADPEKNLMQVAVWDKQFAVAVNGEVVHRGIWLKPDEVYGEIERIGLGSRMKYGNSEVAFKNIRVRKLKKKPKVFSTPDESEEEPAE